MAPPDDNASCKECGKTGNSKLLHCCGCDKLFHAGCVKSQILKNENGAKERFCQSCYSGMGVSSPAIRHTRLHSASSDGSTSSLTGAASPMGTMQPPPPRPQPTLASPSVSLPGTMTQDTPVATPADMASIMSSLAQINRHTEQLDALSNKVDLVQSELSAVKSKLAPLDQLPALITRVDAVEAAVAEHREDLVDLKQKFADLAARLDATPPPAPQASLNKSAALQRVVTAVNSNTASLGRVVAQQQSPTLELVIAGFPDWGTLTDPATLAVAVLNTVKPDLEAALLSNFRFLRKPVTAASTANISADAVPPVDATSRRLRVSIGLKLESEELLHAIINAKRIKGKLMFSEVNSSTLTPSSTPDTNGPDFPVNINKLLPAKTYNLLTKARVALKAVGFRYVWENNGVVFAKLKEGELVYTVNSYLDIDRIAGLHTANPS